MALTIGLLFLTRTSHEVYAAGGNLISPFLAPATVALAVPTFRHIASAGRVAWALSLSVLCGGVAAILTTVVVAHLLGASALTILSLAPRSATTAVSIEVSRLTGGVVSLTAAVTVATGILGALIGSSLLRCLRVDDPRATGLALGTAAHAIGTARALGMGQTAGAFAALGQAGNAVVTSVLMAVYKLAQP